MNVLQWSVGGVDARMRVPAHVFQPFPSFPGAHGPGAGGDALRLRAHRVHRRPPRPGGPAPLAHAGRARHGGARSSPPRDAPSCTPTTRASTRWPTPRAWATYYDDELRAVDRLVGDVLEVLPPGAALVVTADHGQVEVGSSVEVLGPEIMEGVTLISGEGRFRWLHVRARRRAGRGRRRRPRCTATWPGCAPGSRSSRTAGSAGCRRPRSRPGWATWPWCRSPRRPSSTPPTPASSGCRPATAR